MPVLAPDASKAATLDGEIIHAGLAEIVKWEDGPDGSLYVYGRASTPEVDTDEQIVDSGFSAKALQEWLDIAPTLRVQHNAMRDPAGSGVRLEVNRDGDGAHWIKGVVDEPVAQRLVKRRHLRAFSVGISQPVIERDPAGKARGGIIKGGKIVEVSLVDSPANRSCFLEIAKAAGTDGHAEFTGKVFGADILTNEASARRPKTVTVELPKNMSVSIKPSDLAKLAALRPVLARENALKAAGQPAPSVVKRDFDPSVGAHGTDRDKIPDEDFAGRNRSFPVTSPGDVPDALQSIGRAGADNYPAKTLRRNILSIARRKGFPIPASATKAAKSAVTKCGTCGGEGMAGGKPCLDCKKGRRAAKETGKAAQPYLLPLAPGGTSGTQPAPTPLRAGSGTPGVTKKKLKSVCPNCGAKQNRDHRHCPECGNALPPMAPQVHKNHDFVCLSCGKELDKGEKFCPECGTENPGHNPAADLKIPANKATEAGKARVAKGKKGKTPASASGAVSGPERPVGPHREPDGAAVEAFEDDAGMQDGDNEAPTKLESGTLKSAEPKMRKKGKRKKGKKKLPPWLQQDSDDGKDADTGKSALPFDDPEILASLRLKTLGVPEHLGIAHDMTCPAFLPAEVDLCYPGSSLKTLEPAVWHGDLLEKAASADLGMAQEMTGLLAATETLHAADPLDLADLRDGAYKMFREANPGPGTFPSPTEITAQRFHRPYLTDGHAAPSPGHEPPNSAHIPPAGGIQPEAYRRGYLTEGRAADSPANTHPASPMPAPDRTGMPTTGPSRVFYRNSMREGDEHAMRVLHDHIAGRFPAICPMHPHFADTPVPAPAGAPPVTPAPGSARMGEKTAAVTKAEQKAARAAKAARVAKRKAARARRAEKARRARIAAKVLDGSLSVADGQAKLGLPAPVPPGAKTVNGAPEPPVATVLDEATLAAALSKATKPLLKQIARQGRQLDKVRRTADAIAGQPDTATAPFRGVALPKSSGGSPAGNPGFVAKSAEQLATERYAALEYEWRTTTDPAAQAALAKALAPYWNPAMQTTPMPPPT